MPTKSKLIESPCNAILGLAQKFILSRVLMIFAELRLGELLEKKPLTLSEISLALNVHPDALRRFLRLLTAHHVIINIGDDIYSATPISQYFNHLLKASLIEDYDGLDKTIDALKNNNDNLWSTAFGESFQKYLNKYLFQSVESPADDLMVLAHEFILSKVVMAAAELHLEKLVENGPISLNEISTQLNIETRILIPFLKILVQHEILEVNPQDIYSSTPLTKCLDRVLSPHILDGYNAFNGALYTLKNNTGAWEHTFSKSFYDYLNQDERKLQMFKEWCMQSAIDWLPPILSLCDLPACKTFVDVGGGGGHFLSSVLQKNPQMSGILFEQPSIIAGAENNAIFTSLKNRVRFVGGDFFRKIPDGGDIYSICRTLLNWNDEKSIEIINNCHKAMKGKGKLWIIDFIVPSPDNQKYPRAIINDISLFVIFNSAIRTESEWRRLIAKTLFTVSNIYITQEDIKPEPFYPMCVIEATPTVTILKNDIKESENKNKVNELGMDSYNESTQFRPNFS
jgi:hypothetical protein